MDRKDASLEDILIWERITNAHEPDSTGLSPLHYILQSNLPDHLKEKFFEKLPGMYQKTL